jgi:glutamate-1-semialdehyde 2,1-aminomutase
MTSSPTRSVPPPQLAKFRAELEKEFRARFPRSAALCETRGKSLLDQCSHAVRWNEPFQVTVARAEGPAIHDLDGHRIVDYWQGHYANLLGHNPGFVREALIAALREGRGLQSGMVHAIEGEVAELITRCTATDVVRFTTSGALGTFYAVLLARAFTGRSVVLKVAGGWHGSQPFGLKGVSSRGGEFEHLESEGLPRSTQDDLLLVSFNDVEGLERAFKTHGDRIACMLLEPWIGSGGGIAATPEFLRAAFRLTQERGALLLCDEIIAGFRFRAGDVSQMYGVKPDLLILGKVLGGGMPVAAVCGRRDVMRLCTRAVGRVKFEGGTYSAHELSLVAAKVMLEHLAAQENSIYPQLAAKGERLRGELTRVFAEARLPVHVTGRPNEVVPGSSIVMLHVAAHDSLPPQRPENLTGPDGEHPFIDDSLLRAVLLLEGVSARHGVGAVSLAHADADLDATVAAFRRTLARLDAAGLMKR